MLHLVFKLIPLFKLEINIKKKVGLSIKVCRFNTMENKKHFDVIIIGGSYAGLSAGMALGRSLKSTLIIDSSNPCNKQTPHSHNFLTNDGKTPKEISNNARQEVAKYTSITFYNGLAIKGKKIKSGFEITTQSHKTFTSKKLIIATGLKDILPDIPGLKECWGISIIHCPYCHGYEVKNKKTGILGNGDSGFEFSKMIYNWTKDLTLFTNGKSTLTEKQTLKLHHHNIKINETKIQCFTHKNGTLENIVLKNDKTHAIETMYFKAPCTQQSDIAKQLGSEITAQGPISVDTFQRTNIHGLYACGDSATALRSIANSVNTGNISGAMINKELIEEEF